MSQQTIANGQSGLSVRTDLNDNFTELYRRTFLSVAEYGAIGDGVTDDSTALQNAFNAANVGNKNIIFEEGKTYLTTVDRLSFYGGILEGNGSAIKCNQTGSDPSFALSCNGSLGDSYATDTDSIVGTDIIDISNATFLAAVSVGDMLVVSSDKLFVGAKDAGAYQGESMVVIKKGANYIQLDHALRDTYLTSNNTVLYLVNYINRPVIKNLDIIQNEAKDPEAADGSIYGISLQYCLSPVVSNVNIMWAKNYAIDIVGCYQPLIDHVVTEQNNKAGAGYGASITGATFAPIVRSCHFKRCRHAVAHNGATGVVHDSQIIDVIGEGVRDKPIFDAHGGCGRTTWVNCTAIGGVPITETDPVMGEWDSGVTYNQNEIVSKSNVLFQLIGAATSLNEDPETEAVWDLYDNGMSGFVMRADNMNFINCTVINCADGFSGEGWTFPSKNIYANGINMINVISGIRLRGGSEYNNTQFDNINIRNDVYKTEAFCVYVEDVPLEGIKFGKINGSKINGIYINEIANDLLQISELDCSDRVLFDDTNNTGTEVRIGKLKVPGRFGVTEYHVFIRSIDQIEIPIIEMTDSAKYGFFVGGSMSRINLGKCIVKGSTDLDYFIYLTAGFTTDALIIDSVSLEDSNSSRQLIRNQSTITKGHIGIIEGDVSDDYHTSFNRPTLEIIQGDFSKPVISRGTGSPESAIIAAIGSVYYRIDGGANTTLYVKESGAGNTGWIAK